MLGGFGDVQSESMLCFVQFHDPSHKRRKQRRDLVDRNNLRLVHGEGAALEFDNTLACGLQVAQPVGLCAMGQCIGCVASVTVGIPEPRCG